MCFLVVMYCGAIYATTTTVSVAYVPKTGESAGTIGCPSGGESAVGADCNVESGVAWPAPRFSLQISESCMTDNLTGLMWPRNANLFSGIQTWTIALTEVESMNAKPSAKGYNLCGYTDWRLPNINELVSLVNYGQTSPAIWLESQGFSSVQSTSNYWSSSVYASSKGYAWYVSFNDGSMSGRSTSNSYYVWPVRGGR